MYSVKPTKQFKKDLKLIQKRGYDIQKMTDVIKKLAAGEMLPESNRDQSLSGNLLWGYAPQPRFNSNYITKESYSDLIHREGDVLYVDIDEYGHYVLETVNAAGLPLITLYNGTWTVGEHSISLSNYTIDAGNYLVLRKGSETISWKLIK